MTAPLIREHPISFVAFGKPTAQGSARAIMSKRMKAPVVVQVNKASLRSWRSVVADAAVSAMHGASPHRGAVRVDVTFYTPITKAAAKRRDPYPSGRPDRDKLERAVMDALSGIVFVDDCQVCDGRTRKLWGEPARAEFVVTPL